MNMAVNPDFSPALSRDTCEVAIIGAGPYGLATAAHLRAANVPIRIFGEAVSFWRNHMPTGMKLRSPWVATHIATPNNRYTLDDYYTQAGMEVPKLLPVENFIDYGTWFKDCVAPDLDTRAVKRVEALDGGFRLMLEDGEAFFARRVVIAMGLLGHEYRPAPLDQLPRDLVSHSCEHTDSERYRGKRVAVIGRGQSACESAAILHEAGADVEIICRGSLVWNADPGQRSALRKAVRGMLGSMLIPPSQVGPFPYNWLNEAPGIVHNLSQPLRDRVNDNSLGATAITWLQPRQLVADAGVENGHLVDVGAIAGRGHDVVVAARAVIQRQRHAVAVAARVQDAAASVHRNIAQARLQPGDRGGAETVVVDAVAHRLGQVVHDARDF